MADGLFATDQERRTDCVSRGKKLGEDNDNNNNILKTVADDADKAGAVAFVES